MIALFRQSISQRHPRPAMSTRCFFASSSVARSLVLLLLAVAAVLCPRHAHAQIPQLTTVHQFTGQDGEGNNPTPGVIQGRDGNFYGATVSGGTNNTGTVYQVTPEGILTILHTFGTVTSNINTDGANPQTVLVESPATTGTFYGTTNIGGTYGYGTFFRVTSAGVYTVLHSFRDTTTDGSGPTSLTLGHDGNLYGTTASGGTSGAGTIFRYTGAGVFSTIFSAFPEQSYNTPAIVILGSDGNLYGTTTHGNNDYNGSIFELTSGGVYSTLHGFSGSADGQFPPVNGGFLQDGQGNFYGVTTNSGPGTYGTIYRAFRGRDVFHALFLHRRHHRCRQSHQLDPGQ